MKLIILDRDGVINFDSEHFIKSADEWQPIPGSLEAIARLNQAGYQVVVCTNQSGIARGLLTMNTLNAIHQKMHLAAQEVGAEIDAIFFCPHAAADNCDCRKPKSGMFQEIAKRYEISLKGIPNIGDSLRDLQAGFNAGCISYLVLTGKGMKTQLDDGLPPDTLIYPDLAAAVDGLLDATAATPAFTAANKDAAAITPPA
ncbi:MAG: D-glycero-beta-D-manno-heptose 1,7-bisphosphate 7-phosphatase [Burkholderiaceae bacterium]